MQLTAADVLRRCGLQITAQRVAILQAVTQTPHATADAIVDRVRTAIGSISRQSVYDTLGILVDAGLMRRITAAGAASRYETRVGDNHHHLICRSCGQLADVECTVGAAPCLTPSDDQGYQIDEAEVAFWGTCARCAEITAATNHGVADDNSTGPKALTRNTTPTPEHHL